MLIHPPRTLPVVRRRVLSTLERFVHGKEPQLRTLIYGMLSKIDLVALSRTSTRMLHSVRAYDTEAWNMIIFLGFWFLNPMGFRAVLAQSGAVVTGSQVLRFFERLVPLAGSDLDVVTRVGGVVPIVNFLEEEGYRRTVREKKASDDDYHVLTEVFSITSTKDFIRGGGKDCIIAVLDFTRPAEYRRHSAWRYQDDVLKVQVIVVAQRPIDHIILTFHSSRLCLLCPPSIHQLIPPLIQAGVMNYMTHRESVSIFPRLTFGKREFFICSRKPLGEGWNPSWVEKYSRRGYRIETEVMDPGMELGRRRVRDERSWVIETGGRCSDLSWFLNPSDSLYHRYGCAKFPCACSREQFLLSLRHDQRV